jgi:formylglycine-generating enzyme required for sulfatase activity
MRFGPWFLLLLGSGYFAQGCVLSRMTAEPERRSTSTEVGTSGNTSGDGGSADMGGADGGVQAVGGRSYGGSRGGNHSVGETSHVISTNLATGGLSQGGTTSTTNPATGGLSQGGTTSTTNLAAGGLSQGGTASTTNPATGGLSQGGTLTSGTSNSNSSGTGTGCVGNYEMLASGNNLCVAKQVTLTLNSVTFSIDATEVTLGQWNAWTKTNPSRLPSTDSRCGWSSTRSWELNPICVGSAAYYKGNDEDHHPVTCVTWCDAYQYCSGIGKRLCGDLSGENLVPSLLERAGRDAWYTACSSGGVNIYPYAPVNYQIGLCTDEWYWENLTLPKTTTPVGSRSECTTNPVNGLGIYDLSGNVREWIDACESGGADVSCYSQGGSFVSNDFYGPIYLACDSAEPDRRDTISNQHGIRCCSK